MHFFFYPFIWRTLVELARGSRTRENIIILNFDETDISAEIVFTLIHFSKQKMFPWILTQSFTSLSYSQFCINMMFTWNTNLHYWANLASTSILQHLPLSPTNPGSGGKGNIIYIFWPRDITNSSKFLNLNVIDLNNRHLLSILPQISGFQSQHPQLYYIS